MNRVRLHTAQAIAGSIPCTAYPFPRGIRRHRASVVLEHGDGRYVRLTAPGFTARGAVRRLRRHVLRELLQGWWQ